MKKLAMIAVMVLIPVLANAQTIWVFNAGGFGFQSITGPDIEGSYLYMGPGFVKPMNERVSLIGSASLQSAIGNEAWGGCALMGVEFPIRNVRFDIAALVAKDSGSPWLMGPIGILLFESGDMLVGPTLGVARSCDRYGDYSFSVGLVALTKMF